MSCLALLLAAADRGIFELDVVIWPVAEAYDALAAQGPLPVEYRNRLEVGGVKRILDGSPQGKTAYFRDPYFVPLDGRGPEYRGAPRFEQAAVNQAFKPCKP